MFIRVASVVAAAVACSSPLAFARDPQSLQKPASLSVQDHGATGDGLADDAPALAAAFAAAGRAAVARVHLPAGCYAPTFEHCYAWGVKTGYRVVAEGPHEGPEDGAFRRCTANLVRFGIDVRTPTIEPQLVIDDCRPRRAHQIMLTPLYARSFLSPVTSGTPSVDVVATISRSAGSSCIGSAKPPARVALSAEIDSTLISGRLFMAASH